LFFSFAAVQHRGHYSSQKVESAHHRLKHRGGNLRNANIPTLVRRSLAALDDEEVSYMQQAERDKTLKPKRFLYVIHFSF
jgi:hypothetical protein